MDFNFYNPTRLHFGPGKVAQAGTIVAAHGQRALLVTGGGSVRENGTFDRVFASLTGAGVAVVECTGIEPNPRITSVQRGIDIAREEACDVVVALGGGSVMDASKVIAAGVYYDGDPWDMIFHGQEKVYFPQKALPIVTIPTLAATGSESNHGAVITNWETHEKSFVQAECLYPRDAILDPVLTLTVPENHTAYGVCDAIVHVTEGYFNGVDHTPVQDRFAEGVIRTLLEYGPRAVKDGSDLEARTQVQWAACVALNGWVQVGTNGAFPVHMIEHTLSAHHDIPHAAGLAVVNPAWMRFAAKTRPERFAQFARRVFDVALPAIPTLEVALAGIARYEEFLASLGLPLTLEELGIDDQDLERYGRETTRIVSDGQGRLPGRPPMTVEDITALLSSVR